MVRRQRAGRTLRDLETLRILEGGDRRIGGFPESAGGASVNDFAMM